MYSLTLAADFAAWKVFSARKSHRDFLAFSETIFERDAYTCQFCGFQSKAYMEVISLDRQYANPVLASSATACPFCAQCLFLESVGRGDFGGGSLIYLPEMSQAQLNSLCHVLFFAIEKETTYKTTAESIYRNLKFRSQPVEEELGETMSDPSALGRLLMEFGDNHPNLQEAMKTYIRLLPMRSQFKSQIQAWAAEPMECMDTLVWQS